MLNCVTIHALRKTSSLPKPLKILLLSLAVSDLGVGLLVQPLYVASLIMEMEQKTENNPAYNITYNAYVFTVNFFGYASFFGMTALSTDRFLAIHLHLRYQELVTHKRVVAVVIAKWVFSAVLSFLRLWIPKRISFMITAIIFNSFVLITMPLNYKIYIAVRRHTNHVQALQVVQQQAQNEISNTATLRKFGMGTFLVYLAFLVCYLPNDIFLIAFLISGTGNSTTLVLDLYSSTLLSLNSSLNPLIYCLKMRHIRHAVVNSLRNILRSLSVNIINVERQS